MQLSKNFTLEELTHSDTAKQRGINNAPPANSPIMARLKLLASFMEKVRTICGNHPVNVHDAYRSPELNTALHGVSNSAHPEGFAVDFDVAGQTPFQTARIIDQAGKKGILVFDQLILEQLPDPSWVHIGRRLHSEDNTPRMERLTKEADGSYSEGIHQ